VDKPRCLDLFCGAGGATKGLQRDGFHVTGVDINPQPHYCGDDFYQADALTFPLDGYDCYWASPPCQHYSIASARWRHDGYTYPDLIAATREVLSRTSRHYIIENVPGAKKWLNSPILLCGLSFGLGVIRHRWFETSFPCMSPGHENCSGAVTKKLAINDPCGHGQPGHTYRALTIAGHGGNSQSFRWQDWKDAMGIDWMTKQELTQAIPPAYSEYLGKFMMQEVTAAVEQGKL